MQGDNIYEKSQNCLSMMSIYLCPNVLHYSHYLILPSFAHKEGPRITFAQLCFTSLNKTFLPSWIWLYNNTIYCEFSCKLLLKVFCWKRIVQKCRWLLFHGNTFYFDKNEFTDIYSQSMSEEGIVYLLMALNVNTYPNVIHGPSLYAQMTVILVLMRVYWPYGKHPNHFDIGFSPTV